MSVRCGEWRWPKSVVNGLAGMEVGGAGKVREMEARVLFLVANRLILYNLAETLGMPGDAPDGRGQSLGGETECANRGTGGECRVESTAIKRHAEETTSQGFHAL